MSRPVETVAVSSKTEELEAEKVLPDVALFTLASRLQFTHVVSALVAVTP